MGVLVEHLQQTIERSNAVQPVGARIAARVAARAIVGMIESFAYGVFVGGEPFTMEEAVEILSTFCVRGIGVDPARS
ncbi:MAG TPA: hypothetical protein VGR61_10860 [Candidatus Dormibacteraeota bacterium]|nr:hypothetical protein [Candidatus Dormibacteraeota bacterium]